MTRKSRPRIARKARLRPDRTTGCLWLVHPEQGLLLNRTAAAILKLCDGKRDAIGIVEQLGERFPLVSRSILERDVLALLCDLERRGLVWDASAGAHVQ